MTESNNPEPTPAQPASGSEVPPGYDQPAPGYQAPPSYETPAPYGGQTAPNLANPAAPSYEQPTPFGAPAAPSYEQPAPYVAPGYPQQGFQQQGYQQQRYNMVPGGEQKSKVVAGILGILLGSLGIHNFYLGKTKIALIQLLVSVVSFGILAPIMGIWGLIEGILILVGHENYRTDSRGIPLKD